MLYDVCNSKLYILYLQGSESTLFSTYLEQSSIVRKLTVQLALSTSQKIYQWTMKHAWLW